MTRIPSSPPQITPLSDTRDRPAWSVMIPVYNCAKYIGETLESVLVQRIAESKMQIEVIDDASTDANVEEIVNKVGKGRIKYFRQEKNVGSLRNFETCINRSRGHFVHILHGDDKINNGYYDKIGGLFQKYPQVGAAFCRYDYIDGKGQYLYDQPAEIKYDGIIKNWILRIGKRNTIQFAAIVVKREVYEKLGSFYALTYGEDWEMWVRIARDYPVAYTPDILAQYRKHADSITGKKFLTGEYLLDIVKAMELIQDHLPEKEKKRVLKKSKKFYGHYGVKTANKVWHSSHNRFYVNSSVGHSVMLHKDLLLYYRIFKIHVKMFLREYLHI